MKFLPILLCFSFWLILAAAHAQRDDAIRVTTTLRPDGTRVDSEVNPAEGTSTETISDAGGKMLQKIIYKLDAEGHPAEGIAYDPAGKPVGKVAYKRDAAGRVTEQTEFTPTGQTIRRLVYEYNASGKLTNIEAFDADGNRLSKKK